MRERVSKDSSKVIATYCAFRCVCVCVFFKENGIMCETQIPWSRVTAQGSGLRLHDTLIHGSSSPDLHNR